MTARTRGRRGVLTTDHPASSYGLPVLVVDGQVYGSWEWTHPIHVAADADPGIVAGAVRAGYDVRQEDEGT